ncbi:MAG: UvrD-helicase domain-containing protein [Acidobacteria bacterium]|nr:UvrD-helicase domain-containing protein [Acidobacteriota bacterium]
MVDLSVLNEQQREAVAYVGGPLLVSAGAGSGKTRVITYKIAHLIYNLGVDPSSILAVTFTNKAANEMRERVLKLLQAAEMRLTVSTFHSFCARFLRQHAGVVGLSRAFTIADVAEQERVLKRAIEKGGIKSGGTTKRWLSAISRTKERGLFPEDAAKEAASHDQRALAEIYAAYQKELRDHACVDFDDLLLYSVTVLKKRPDVHAAYRDSLGYILIDEYQDTNFLQFELVRLLAAQDGKGLCVVGDEDQSIYGWRGASIDHIRRFERDFSSARVVLLEQNYRSTGHILAGASALIGNNSNRYEKTLRSSRDAGHTIEHFEGDEQHGEVDFVVDELRRLVSDNKTPAAILYRANHMSRAFEDGLVRAGLKYRIVGSLRFYERREIKDLAAYLRLLANPRDTQAFSRAANVPPRKGLGPKSIEAVLSSARDSDTDLLTAATGVAAGGGVSAAASTALREFVQVVRHIGDPSGAVAPLLRNILSATAYEENIRKHEPPEEVEDRLANVKEFVDAADEFDRENRGGLLDFLDSISLTTGQDEVDSAAPILLMTIHCAKGLEFPSVFLVNMNENAFPLPHVMYRPDDLEEERRLCYVGMTRAMHRLYLTSNAMFMPSRFLREIESSGSLTRREVPALHKMPPYSRRAYAGPPHRARHPFKPTDRVSHATFGTGTVLNLDGEGETATATVAFDQHGVKRLVLGFAKLSRA